MEKFKRTNVFATSEETAKIKEEIINLRNTPVIAFSTEHALSGGLSGDAEKRTFKMIHELALAKGLPDFQGYYGFDTEAGEFLEIC